MQSRTLSGRACALALAVGTFDATLRADGPIVDAAVATIAAGTLPNGIGVQGAALNADRTLLYIAEGTRTTTWSSERGCSGSGTIPQPGTAGFVGIFDTSARTRIADLPLSAGFPVHAELDPSTGRVYVVASSFGVYAFEGTAQAGASPALGAVPHDIGIDPTNGHGVVTNTFEGASQSHVTLIDLATLQVIRHINTGGFGPHKAAVDPSLHLAYISHADFAKVDVIDTRDGQMLRQISTGLERGGAQNAIDLSRRRLYAVGVPAGSPGSSRVVAIDLATEQPVGVATTLPSGGHGMRVDSATGLLWVVLEEQAQVAVIDPDTMTERARIPVGHCPYYLDIDPVRRLAYVTNQGDNTISVVDMTKVPDAGSSLPAPANLTYAVSGTMVSLTWGGASGAASYDLEAGSGPGLSDLAVLNTTALGFTATAGPGTYYVRVRARSATGGSSNASNEVVITIGNSSGCSAAPGPPSGLRAAVGEADTVVLTWSAATGFPASYIVEAGSRPGLSDLANSDLGSTATSFAAPGVPAGTYYVRVRARNACGAGGESNEVVVVV